MYTYFKNHKIIAGIFLILCLVPSFTVLFSTIQTQKAFAYCVTDNWVVTLPKEVNENTYEVIVDGVSDYTVNVVPDAYVVMHQNKKEDKIATIFQDKIAWEYDDFGKTATGNIDYTMLSAGKWYGNFSFYISSTQNTINVIDRAYPIGSIYINVNDINPEEFFGGKWQKIENAYLWAAGKIDGNGGNSTIIPKGTVNGHAVTIDEMPSHNHGSKTLTGELTINNSKADGASLDATASYSGIITGTSMTGYGSDINGTDWQVWKGFSVNLNHSHSYNGNNQTHTHTFTGTETDNMSPYMAVNVYKRIA